MPLFFGRRHSISGGTQPEEDGIVRDRARRRTSLPDFRSVRRGSGLFQGLLRRPSKVSASAPPSPPPEKEEPPLKRSNSAPKIPAITVPPGVVPSPPPSPREGIIQAEVQREPKRRAGEYHRVTSIDTVLGRDDIEHIFSGAPYFLLEKGKYRQYYPIVIFPLDDHDSTIQNLWDRQLLPHATYTLCTLHAHLPVPEGWVNEGETSVQLTRWTKVKAPKRATFDVGLFEVPNMLTMNGIEPGTVGFSHFLEIPVGDAAVFNPQAKTGQQNGWLRLTNLSAVEAYELMEHHGEPYAQCKDGTNHDRKQLLHNGPSAWKRIGVRDIELQALVNRLQFLKELRNDILHKEGNAAGTILDVESAGQLYTGLFTKFLFPPSRFMTVGVDEPRGLKAQIKAITTVLATPGAWFDFCYVDWRLHAGQLLWESAPHADGDFFDSSQSDRPWVFPSLERKWFLIQMLLSAELLLRLDASVRVGFLRRSGGLSISARDVQNFDQLRTKKVDWDLVVARRFMDSFDFSYGVIEAGEVPRKKQQQQQQQQPGVRSTQQKAAAKRRHLAFLESLRHRPSTPTPPSTNQDNTESAWKCNLIPGRVDQQLVGLYVFAEMIGWPQMDDLKKRLRFNLGEGELSQQTLDAFCRPVHNAPPEDVAATLKPSDMYTRTRSYRPLLLQTPGNESPGSSTVGGVREHPRRNGQAGPASEPARRIRLQRPQLVEQGVRDRTRAGPLPATKHCLAWMGCAILPLHTNTGDRLDDTWLEVDTLEPPAMQGTARIKAGQRLSIDSSPFGMGGLTSGTFSLPKDPPLEQAARVQIDFDDLTLTDLPSALQSTSEHRASSKRATMSFSLATESEDSHQFSEPSIVQFPLKYNVRFVSSHECRTPAGFISYQSEQGQQPQLRHHRRLPGHPLHRSFSYRTVGLDGLPGPHAPGTSFAQSIGLSHEEVVVVDARGSREKETFARAWCAAVGYHAIVGRVGRTCVACCVREARAFECIRRDMVQSYRNPSSRLRGLRLMLQPI
ncbi:hypothetical protein P168DRAFT_306213 [Aspergillus campestris IBT 28561]|uniref:Uncharacterized protein n=1 Tax=Aspergillus campestris (strain IBT 28561) TaxID=1392248 RepID=A0A2I1CWJ1_ASPC2|nr:uncharacterized protein P168DRAFT_306213 [Aspergillus campestris IBT 28561]PKY01975.1 hypothetical protein P168DRAFT_306213 [Aspergillus campestris IBT 28561]